MGSNPTLSAKAIRNTGRRRTSGVNPPKSPRGLLVALSLIGAGLIHLAAIRSHVGSPMAIASFTGIGLVQILLGASLLQAGAERLKQIAVVGVGALAVATWFVSRTWGLPAISGHAGPERFGVADVAAAGMQLVSLVLILLPQRAKSSSPRRRITTAFVALPVLAVSALASFSLLSVPTHGHAHLSPIEVRAAVYTPGRALTKRAVPVPPVSGPVESKSDDHADAPAHSH